MRNNFPKRSSSAPIHTLSKLYDVPVGFVTPPLIWVMVYFICGRQRVAVTWYRIVDLSCTITSVWMRTTDGWTLLDIGWFVLFWQDFFTTVDFGWFVAFLEHQIFRVFKIHSFKFVIVWVYYTIPLALPCFGTLGIHFNFLNYFLWLRITDEDSVPEMRIWSISFIKSDLKWCTHLSRNLF